MPAAPCERAGETDLSPPLQLLLLLRSSFLRMCLCIPANLEFLLFLSPLSRVELQWAPPPASAWVVLDSTQGSAHIRHTFYQLGLSQHRRLSIPITLKSVKLEHSGFIIKNSLDIQESWVHKAVCQLQAPSTFSITFGFVSTRP